MKHDLIALIDMDGTIADFDGAMRRDLMKLVGPEEMYRVDCNTVSASSDPDPICKAYASTYGYISNGGDLHHLEKVGDHWKARMDLIKNQPGWWRDLASLLPTIFKTTSELEVGDLISEDYGVWVVAYLILEDGCYKVFDSDENGFVETKPNQTRHGMSLTQDHSERM